MRANRGVVGRKQGKETVGEGNGRLRTRRDVSSSDGGAAGVDVELWIGKAFGEEGREVLQRGDGPREVGGACGEMFLWFGVSLP